MKWKRFTGMLLVAGLVASLMTGCGSGAGSNDQQTGESQNGDSVQTAGNEENEESKQNEESGEPYEIAIEMLNFGMEDPDMQEVEDKMNEILLPAINATVKFVPTSFFEMATKPGLWNASGEKVDVLITGMMTTPQQLAAQGLLTPLDEVLANSQTLTDLAGDLLLACKYDDQIYAYPLDLYSANGAAFFYDLELAEQYNIDVPDTIETEADLESVFAQVKASGMEQSAFTYGDGELTIQSYGYDHENFGDNYVSRGAILLDGSGDTNVVNWYATDTFRDICHLHRDWMEKGYLTTDALTNGETIYDLLRNRKIFGFINGDGASVGKAYYEAQAGRKLGRATIGNITARTCDIVINTWGISSLCENPQKVIEFMEMLYTDAELANLFNFGIEGKHYVTEEGSRLMSYPEGVDASSNGYGSSPVSGSFGDRTIMNAWGTTWTQEDLDAVTQYGIKEADKSEYLGLSYNMNNVSTENAAVMSVIMKYRGSLMCGVVEDVDATVDAFISELEAAGMDKIIADTQAQVDAFLEQN